MKKYLIFAVMTVLIAVILIPISAGADNENNSSNAEISAAPVSVAADDDFRGVWISTVYNLDFPVKATTNSQTLKNYIDSLIENCVNLGFNNVILQVSPCSDAIYPSEILPWSKYLTGKQGTAPDNGFDPLQYWVEQCHKNSLKIHAWINPYRITKVSSDFEELSENHPAVKNPSWVVKYSDGNYYYDPSVPQVRELVNSVVTEILQNYGVMDVDHVILNNNVLDKQDYEILSENNSKLVYSPSLNLTLGNKNANIYALEKTNLIGLSSFKNNYDLEMFLTNNLENESYNKIETFSATKIYEFATKSFMNFESDSLSSSHALPLQLS